MSVSDINYKGFIEARKKIEQESIEVCLRMLELEDSDTEEITIEYVYPNDKYIAVGFSIGIDDDNDFDMILVRHVKPEYLFNRFWENEYKETIEERSKKAEVCDGERGEYVGPFLCPHCENRTLLQWRDMAEMPESYITCPYCTKEYSLDAPPNQDVQV